MTEGWVRGHGGSISEKLQILDIPGRGKSVLAKEPINAGETLIELPRAALINARSLDEPDLTSHQMLAKQVLSGDEWTAELPQSFEGVPLTWKDSDIEYLPQKYRSHVKTQKQQLVTDRLAVEAGGAEIDPEKWQWAWLCVNSRCLYWDVGRASEENMTLAPFIDFLNHCCDQSQSVVVKSGLKMTVKAAKSYAPGDEVLLSYGPHENAFLLCEYGFVASERNMFDYIDITEQILPRLSEPLRKELKELGYLGDYTYGWDGPCHRTLVALSGVENPSLLQAVASGTIEPRPEPLEPLETRLEELYSVEPPLPELKALYRGYLEILKATRL